MSQKIAKPVHLRVVGVPYENKQKRVLFEVNRVDGQFTDEKLPHEEESESKRLTASLRPDHLQHNRTKFLINEDPRKSRFSHSKLMAIEKLSCLLTTLIFFLSCCKTEMDVLTENPSSNASLYIMYTMSVCVAALIFTITLRYAIELELEHDQNKVYLSKNPSQWWLITFFTKSDKVWYWLLEVGIILPHPVAGLVGITCSLFQTYDEIYLNHSYNDLLALACILKVYIIVRSLVSITTYSSPRASRLCYQNGFEHSLLYIVKCILHEQPLTAIGINFLALIMIFGYALKITEGVLFLYNPETITGFEEYNNCFWCIFITMSTVGYGDYYPKTLPGRIIILVTAISGVLLSSLLIVSLSLYLDMAPSELKSHITLHRLGEQKLLLGEASKALSETVCIHKLMGNGCSPEELNSRFLKLKTDIDSVKARSRKIKSIVDTDNIIQEMNRLFYILKDSLKDIFVGQLKLREEIGKIEEIQSIKLSFIKEVTEMLSKSGITTNTVSQTEQKKKEVPLDDES